METLRTHKTHKVARPYYAETVEHWDENYNPTKNAYHVSSDNDVLFDLIFKTLEEAEAAAERLNNAHEAKMKAGN